MNQYVYMECTVNPRFLFRRDEGCAKDFSIQAEPQYVAVHAPPPPGETKQQKAARLYATMEGHIFNGDPRNPDAGRHTLSAWCATHKGASGICNTESKLCRFNFVRFSSAFCDLMMRLMNDIQGKNKVKTVWNDGAGGYARGDIATLCKASILHNLDQSRLNDRSFMIQTHLKRPICVMHQVSGDGSCFPEGINFRKNIKDMPGSVKIGDQCPRGGTGNAIDDKKREAKVTCPK